MTINKMTVELLLAEREMSQTELAARSGISRQSVSTILQRGTAAPKNVGKLAAGLGVPVADIIKED